MVDPHQVWLLRHGQTDWNLEGRLQGRSDIALNDTGIAGARQAAATMAGWRFARILSSPLGRAMQTAQIVAEPHGIAVESDPRLIERDFGGLEGLLHPEILARDGMPENFVFAETLPEGGESWSQLKTRMHAVYRDLQPAQGAVLIVSHLAALTALTEALDRAPPQLPNSTPIMLRALPQLSGCGASA